MQRAAIGILALLGGLWSVSVSPAFAADVVFAAMDKELERSMMRLRNAEKTPLYYLGYTVTEFEAAHLSATLGARTYENRERWRVLDVDIRIGSATLDNTHEMTGADSWMSGAFGYIPRSDDEVALRAALWRLTDRAYKGVQNRFTKVQRNIAVTAAEEDTSGDFSPRPAAKFTQDPPAALPGLEAFRERLEALSLKFKPQPHVYSASVYLNLEKRYRRIVDSEGSRLATGAAYYQLGYSLATRTVDGMDLDRRRNYDADNAGDLPSDEVVLQDMQNSIDELEALRNAPLVDPFSGPAILKSRACAVYFHEILGHRLEGHRQKSENEGQTFTKKLGEKIVADFISVTDDPTQRCFRDQFLRGFYAYDDEGTAAQPAVLIADGVLEGFLLSRSPIRGFPVSNGHGRRQSGRRPVARMANTIVTASRTVPYSKLRQMLIEEVRRQNKPYGLVFDDIAGGFTGTQRGAPQSFKILPLLVYRVYPDGRPDEVVRGVDIVGTPLTSFTKILAAADDDAVFNGDCGAESGWLPVSGVAPSVLISEIEVEKRQGSQQKPPVLPPPHHDENEPRATRAR